MIMVMIMIMMRMRMMAVPLFDIRCQCSAMVISMIVTIMMIIVKEV